MNSKKKFINELHGQRREHIESSKRNDDFSHKQIAENYSEAEHYIYELLQNADDAKAIEVRFKLEDKGLKIIHNGKPFDKKDVDSITTIGYSTKTEGAIGKFGSGFKSVFNITKAPEIHSGGVHFKYIIIQAFKFLTLSINIIAP